MVILRESPWYQEILKEGLQQGLQRGKEEGKEEGLQQGKEEGLQQGKEEGKADLLIRLLSKRFGNLDSSLESRIRELAVSQIEALGDNLFDFSSLDDVDNWLENQV